MKGIPNVLRWTYSETPELQRWAAECADTHYVLTYTRDKDATLSISREGMSLTRSSREPRGLAAIAERDAEVRVTRRT